MSLRYALLGLLLERPMHGYAIPEALEERLGSSFWRSSSQVYQALSALEADGMVRVASERVGRRPPRKIYSTNARGEAVLHGWLESPVPSRDGSTDDWFLRMTLASRAGMAEVQEILDRAIDAAHARAVVLRCDVEGRGEPRSLRDLIHHVRDHLLLARQEADLQQLRRLSDGLARLSRGESVRSALVSGCPPARARSR